MKKIVIGVTVIVMILSIACAESITLHNGVQFCMTKDEVKQLEKYASPVRGTVMKVETEYLGGIPGGSISYYFNEEKLMKCEYQFGETSKHVDLKQTYTTKYGTPFATNTPIKEVTGIAGSTSDALKKYHAFVDDYTFYYGSYLWSKVELNGIYQWFVPTDDGGIVEIVLVCYERTGTHSYSINEAYYFYRTPEESQAIYDVINQKDASYNDI